MFTLSVPGSSMPGRDRPDAIVVGTRLDIVDALLSAGMQNVVLACSTDALRHALTCAAGRDLVLIFDPSPHGPTLTGLGTATSMLSRCTVLVRGTHVEPADRAALTRAAATIWCDECLTPMALARTAQHRMAA
jgi:hypothetical protein